MIFLCLTLILSNVVSTTIAAAISSAPDATITSAAPLVRRDIGTLGWYSLGEVDGTVRWRSYTYDAGETTYFKSGDYYRRCLIGQPSSFCPMYTTCSDGYMVGASDAQYCTKTCGYNRLFSSYGDEAGLTRVICDDLTLPSKTFYQTSPPVVFAEGTSSLDIGTPLAPTTFPSIPELSSSFFDATPLPTPSTPIQTLTTSAIRTVSLPPSSPTSPPDTSDDIPGAEVPASDPSQSPSPSNSPTPSPQPPTINRNPPKNKAALIGTIVGSVFGGLILLGICVGIFFTVRRKRAQAKANPYTDQPIVVLPEKQPMMTGGGQPGNVAVDPSVGGYYQHMASPQTGGGIQGAPQGEVEGRYELAGPSTAGPSTR